MTLLPPPARFRRLLRLLVALVLAGLITHGTYAGTGDEPHYLAIAHSLAFDGDLDVANNYGASEPLIAGGNLDAGPHVLPDKHGITRPIHDIGLPLLLVPVVRVAVPVVRWIVGNVPSELLRRVRVTPSVLYRQILSLFMIALAVSLAGLLFDAFLDVGAHPRAAWAAALIIMLSPPLMIYSTLLFTELVSAFLCLYAFRRVARADREPVRPLVGGTGGRDAAACFVTGGAVGLLLLVHVRNAGLVVALTGWAAYRLYRDRRWRDVALFAIGLAVPIALRTVITYTFWGTLITTPHGRLGESAGLGAPLREAALRLSGLLFDQEYGLIVYGPIYALAVSGLVVVERRWLVRLLAVAGSYLALVIWPATNVHGWTGQWCPAARMMVPIAPLLALPLVAGMRALPRAIVLPVLALQLVISAYMWQNPKNLWNDGNGIAAVCERSAWRLCAYLPSFTREGR